MSKSDWPRLEIQSAALLVVDMQEKLLGAMNEAEACISAVRKLSDAARVLGVPLLLTEQYPAGLGATCPAIRQAVGQTPAVEKLRFSACIEEVTRALQKLARPHILVAGIETHVCVQQTVLDLLRGGYIPYVCADAVSSRRPLDREVALRRMERAGAIVTTVESVIFEWLGEAGTDAFKQVLRIVK